MKRKIGKFLKKLLGWYLFAEAVCAILNVVGYHVVAKVNDSFQWDLGWVITGHIVAVIAAALFNVTMLLASTNTNP